MIRVELTEDQAAIVLRALRHMETIVEAVHPPNDYQRAMQKHRLAEIFDVMMKVVEARDASRADGDNDKPAAVETTPETPPETAQRPDISCKVRPDVWVHYERMPWERGNARFLIPGGTYPSHWSEGDSILNAMPHDAKKTIDASIAGLFDGDGNQITHFTAINWATVKQPLEMRDMRWSVVRQREDGMGEIVEQFPSRERAVKSQAFTLAKGAPVSVQWERVCYGLPGGVDNPRRIVKFRG